MRLQVPARPVDYVCLLVLAFVCYQGHQLVRHLVGGALCGGLGTMTFTVATTRQPCRLPAAMALVGPVFTFGLAYLGMALLRVQRWALFGFALIFASFAHLRFIQILSGRGDELDAAALWFARPSQLAVALAVLLVGIPPVVAAFRTIANPHRWRVFAGAWLGPLPLLFVMLVANRLLFGDANLGALRPTLGGVAPLVVVVDSAAVTLMGLLLARRRRGAA